MVYNFLWTVGCVSLQGHPISRLRVRECIVFIDWQMLCFFSAILMHFYFIDWSFLTHALPPVQLQITEVICQPWSMSLAASHCVIDPLLHWWLATHPTTTRKTAQGHPLQNACPPPSTVSVCLLPSIHPYMHIYIHPSRHSPTLASHASVLTSLITQGLSQSAVWAVVHFDHLLLQMFSTFFI